MNKKKALQKAEEIIRQKPKPKELNKDDVVSILEGLGFECKKKHSDHTTFRYYHTALENSGNFLYGILKISVGHKKGAKEVIRIGSVRQVIKALEEVIKNEEKNN